MDTIIEEVVESAVVIAAVDRAIVSISGRNLVEREEITEAFEAILKFNIDAPDAFLILTNAIERAAGKTVIDTASLIDTLLDVRNAIEVNEK